LPGVLVLVLVLALIGVGIRVWGGVTAGSADSEAEDGALTGCEYLWLSTVASQFDQKHAIQQILDQ